MSSSTLLNELIEALRCLPGVGAKTAQRMAFHVLERDRAGARRLAEKLSTAMERIGNCSRCRTFSESPICVLCASDMRDATTWCVVETPADQLAIEQATGYRGRYFVLLGRLSPLDGLGPKELGLDALARRLAEGEIKELIVAAPIRRSRARRPRTCWRKSRVTPPPCVRPGWRMAFRSVASLNSSIAARLRMHSAAGKT